MLRANRLKRRLAAGAPSVGCWLFMGSPSTAELLSHLPFDALIADLEHRSTGIGTMTDQLRAANGGTQPTLLVRVPDARPETVKPVLDSGAEGLLLPCVERAEDLAGLVAAASYPPHGVRGLHYTVSRAAGWGAYAADYPAHAAGETLIVAMIESAAGVQAIPEMAKVTGIDMFFIGPLDLSASIGVAGRWDDPGFLDLWREAERRIVESGVALGGTILPGHGAAALFERGYRFATLGADAGFLRNAALAALAA